VTVWRDPAEQTSEYPGLFVHDGRVTGSITAGQSRLPLWAFAGWDWGEVVASYPQVEEYGWTEQRHAGFLHHLLQHRGEFARLLLVLADAERRDREREEDDLTAPVWWDDPDLSRPVIEQLRRCLAALESGRQQP
jgi:hypothetical protein